MVAWIFVCQQVVLKPWQVHDGTDHLKDVRMKIITKCGGLRLAIKVMGGLLSTKPRSEGALPDSLSLPNAPNTRQKTENTRRIVRRV